jgi:hypothetical protein
MTVAIRLLVAMTLLLALDTAPSMAKIAKTAQINCKTGRICFYWWPELPHMKGWHTDSDVNYSMGENGINVLIPDGYSFANAGVIIYAEAVYKPRYESSNPKTKTLEGFIADDEQEFRTNNPGDLTIADTTPLKTGDGYALRSVTYFRPKAKNWERVSFGEEGDYYLIFTLNAHSLKEYDAAQKTYESLLNLYKQ